MKANKIMMAFAAIAATATVGCTQDEELLGNSGNAESSNGDAVAFGTYLSGAAETRATVMDLPALKETGFGVFGYYTGTEDYNIVNPNHLPNFMYNQEVTWKGDGATGAAEGAEDTGDAGVTEGGKWLYSPVKYWPNDLTEKVSFFAYAPFTDTFGETGITGITSNTTKGDPKLSFKMDENVDNEVDLLYCNEAMDLRKQNIAGKVDLKFKHALSRIGFKRVAVIDENNNGNGMDDDNDIEELNKHGIALTKESTVVINSVSISSSEFGESGDFNLRTGGWENRETGSQTYTLTAGDFINSTLTSDDATEVKKLTKDDKYLMVMPTPVKDQYSNESIPVQVTVNFDVITEDPKLVGGKSKITSEVTAPFNFAFRAGKSYNFVLHIGLTSVKLDATVEDWIDKEHWEIDNVPEVENFVVNTPSNDTFTLVLDALDGRFRNGSRYYVMTTTGMNPQSGKVEDAVFEIPYFYNNPLNWQDPENDIYSEYQLPKEGEGFTCWSDKKITELYYSFQTHPSYLQNYIELDHPEYEGAKFYSHDKLIFKDPWGEAGPANSMVEVPSESSITIPVDDPTRFRILYAVWPIGENHVD